MRKDNVLRGMVVICMLPDRFFQMDIFFFHSIVILLRRGKIWIEVNSMKLINYGKVKNGDCLEASFRNVH